MKYLDKKFIVSISVVALLIGSTFMVNAQRGEIGARLMPTFSSVEINTSAGGNVKGTGKIGLGLGALLGFNFTDNIGVQGEVIYSSISQKYTDQDVEQEINLRYINLPLLLSLNTGKLKVVNLNLVAGPQLGFQVGSSVQASGDDGEVSAGGVLAVKKNDVGFAYGAGLDFGLNEARTFRLGIGFRGVIGLIQIGDDGQSLENDEYYLIDKSHMKTYSGYIGISYLFGSKEL